MSLVGLALFNLLRVLEWIVIIDVVLSWLPIELPKDVQRVLRTITEPVYGLIRRNLPTTWSGGGFDPSSRAGVGLGGADCHLGNTLSAVLAPGGRDFDIPVLGRLNFTVS